MGVHRPATGRDLCPDRETLLAFMQGEVDEPVLASVGDHLTRCGECLATLSDLHSEHPVGELATRVRDCFVGPEGRGEGNPAAGSPPRPVSARLWLLASPPLAPRADEPLRRRVGRYSILEQIGEGGMGVVFRAKDPVIDQDVALKMISELGHLRPDRVTRFRAEGQALARLRHPNVVQFYHFDEQGGRPYYTMELVEGGSLEQKLAAGPLPFLKAAGVVRTLALALHAAHLQRVIHRDLKPSNVLFANDGTPKIADFGLAKLLDATGEGLTGSEAVIGTASYMAPEQAEGQAGIDCRADVYALGAVLYATLTGRPPYEGPDKWHTLRMVVRADLTPPDRLRAELPHALAAICTKCLERSPAHRYPSAQQLADDLTDWLEGRRPRWLPSRTARALRVTRRRAIVAGLGLGLGGVLLYRNHPHRVRQTLEAELARGHPVTLLSDDGTPAWSHWVCGADKSQQSHAGDGAFTLRSWDLTLLELVADPQTEAFHLAAQVRHEMSDKPGAIGLYVARVGHTAANGAVHFFTQAAFNDVRRSVDAPIVLRGGRTVPPADNVMEVSPHLHSGTGSTPDIDCLMGGASGPTFTPSGEGAGHWRTVELTVTPNAIAARWEGESFFLPVTAVANSAAAALVHLRSAYAGHPFVDQLRPAFSPRGGLGLYLLRGSGSFRSVTLTPLNADGRPTLNDPLGG